MSIKVTCPNGHELQVKNEFAGKTGVCPTCKARIVVPVPEPKAVSEDELLAVLGTPRFVPRVPVSDEPAPRHSPVAVQGAEAKKEAVAAGSAIGTSGGAPRETAAKKEAVAPAASALLRRKKVCPICCDIISVGHSECPLCQTSLSEWTFPLPEEHPRARERTSVVSLPGAPQTGRCDRGPLRRASDSRRVDRQEIRR